MAKDDNETRGLPPLIPQPHGGALLAGGVPGNAGGTGRPPNELREKLRRVLDANGVDLVSDVIQGRTRRTLTGRCEFCGEEPSDPDDAPSELPSVDNRLRAVDIAAKFGLGERSEFSEDVVVKNLDRTLAVAESFMLEADFKSFAQSVDDIWNGGRRG